MVLPGGSTSVATFSICGRWPTARGDEVAEDSPNVFWQILQEVDWHK